MTTRIGIQLYILLLCGIFFINIGGCKKTDDSPIIVETGSVTDVELNVYKTIKIGNQWWMVDNLKVKKYRNGLNINMIGQQDSLSWVSTNSGAFCLYTENPNAPGLLYNWYAIHDTNKLAPEGWHIPSDEEWKELELYLGLSQDEARKTSWRGTHEGEKLKMTGQETWSGYQNIWATNESGFSAEAGGCRLFDGRWSTPSGFGYTGFWWTSTEYMSEHAWYRHLDYKNAGIFRSHVIKTYGFSVRCIKD